MKWIKRREGEKNVKNKDKSRRDRKSRRDKEIREVRVNKRIVDGVKKVEEKK